MSKCIDASIGTMLHAYELKLLSEEDVHRFETHLIHCEYCFAKVQEFGPYATALHTGPEAQEAMQGFGKQTDESPGRVGWRDLWSTRPVLLSPALLAIVILALLYPAYLGLFESASVPVQSLQAIRLVPDRSGNNRIDVQKDVVITFVFEDAEPDRKYQIQLTDSSGVMLYETDSYTDFDKYGTGVLFVPRTLMSGGEYRLLIVDPASTVRSNTAEYIFTVGR